MNQSRSMGHVAQEVVKRLKNSWLAADFLIEETPRACTSHTFKLTAPLKTNSSPSPPACSTRPSCSSTSWGLTPVCQQSNGPGLHLLLNHFVEDVQNQATLELVVRDTLSGQAKTFQAGKVVLAAGSIESPKLLLRSSIYPSLAAEVRSLVGFGLTDHPTTDKCNAFVDGIGGINLTPHDHFKIIFYSRGLRDDKNEIRYPFNVEMNINHEYWHLRKNDPADLTDADLFVASVREQGKAVLDIKFSFGNCLDDDNEVKPPPLRTTSPRLCSTTLSKVERLAKSRFPALAGWKKSPPRSGTCSTASLARSFRCSVSMANQPSRDRLRRARAEASAMARSTMRPGLCGCHGMRGSTS